MATGRILLGTNWKMNKSLAEAIEYSRQLGERQLMWIIFSECWLTSGMF
jgi:hypothetical protein